MLVRELGGFDVMINNAGIAQVQPLADVTPQEVKTIFKVNIEGVLWGIQAAAKKFKARGHKGKIFSASYPSQAHDQLVDKRVR